MEEETVEGMQEEEEHDATMKVSPESIRKKLPIMRIRPPRQRVTATRKRKWRWMSMYGPLL